MTAAVFERYRKARTVQYLNDVLEIITVEDAETLKIKAKYTALQTAVAQLNEAWNPTLASVFTADIQHWDTVRDSMYSGLKGTLTVWARYHYDETLQNHAQSVLNALGHYTNGSELTRLPYQEETAEMTALLNELHEKHTEALTALALTEWVSRMREANEVFAKQYIERTKEMSNHEEGIVEQRRTEAVKAYREMVNLLNARMAIAEEEGAATFAKYQRVHQLLEQLAEQNNEAANRSRQEGTSSKGQVPRDKFQAPSSKLQGTR